MGRGSNKKVQQKMSEWKIAPESSYFVVIKCHSCQINYTSIMNKHYNILDENVFLSVDIDLSFEPSFSLFEEKVKTTDTCKHDLNLTKIWHEITRLLDQLWTDTKKWSLIENKTMQLQCNQSNVCEIKTYFDQ